MYDFPASSFQVLGLYTCSYTQLFLALYCIKLVFIVSSLWVFILKASVLNFSFWFCVQIRQCSASRLLLPHRVTKRSKWVNVIDTNFYVYFIFHIISYIKAEGYVLLFILHVTSRVPVTLVISLEQKGIKNSGPCFDGSWFPNGSVTIHISP